ncbi:MAG: hypothetical protein ACK5YR_07790 [Pirellula sp.]
MREATVQFIEDSASGAYAKSDQLVERACVDRAGWSARRTEAPRLEDNGKRSFIAVL